ncbi:TPA: Eaa protein [Escherichia coli]|nr:Eaa protein [Escherichia coli]
MTTITDKKQYPGEQYLNELITNIEFAARTPVEVVRAMAAELQKRREADSAEPASNHEELPLDYLQGQKDGLEWAAQLAEANHPQTGDWLYDDPLELAKAIRKGPDMPEFDGPTPVTPDGWISCSERMPEMGERQCYVLAADFKNNYPPNIPNTQVGVYGDWFNDGKPTWDDGDGEDLYLKEVTHWMPLPEPPEQDGE